MNVYNCRYSECKHELEEVSSDQKIGELKATLLTISQELKILLEKLQELPRKRNNADKRWVIFVEN